MVPSKINQIVMITVYSLIIDYNHSQLLTIFTKIQNYLTNMQYIYYCI